jgi:hypothetical protein
MSNSGKNIIIVLGVITVVFAGYYFFTQEASQVLRSSESDRQLEQMLRQTQQFVEHRNVLTEVTLDTEILQLPEFRSLRTFSPEPNQFPVGRNNPFEAVQSNQPILNQDFSSDQ